MNIYPTAKREPGARDKLISEGKRRIVEQMLDAGYSVSKISRNTGIAYSRVKLYAQQYEGEKPD